MSFPPVAAAGRKAGTRLRIESLEDRVVPSWGSTPPATISVPTAFTSVTLNAAGDATGTATISNNEIDWYRFSVSAGSTTFSASTPTSSLDTVIGVYSTAGQRVAFNDDISSTNRDSRTTVTLAAGTYFLGVTNYVRTPGGAYTWAIDAPAAVPPVVPPVVPPAVPPPSAGAFDIALRASGLTAAQRAAFDTAAAVWERIIVGDLPNATYNGVTVDDVLIDASVVSIDGRGGVLGQAGPTRLRSGTALPIHGVMQFDAADLAALEASGQLVSTIVHEMGHVLGIGTIWRNLGLISGAGGSDPRFTGRQATAAYNQIFGTNFASVPVENTGGAGTRDGHWRESVFGNELMTGFLNSGANPLSRVTAAALADMGYVVNLAAADAYTPGGTAALTGGAGGGGSGRGLIDGTGGGCGCDLCRAMRDTAPTMEARVVSPGVAPFAAESTDAVAVTTPASPRPTATATAADEPVARATPRPAAAGGMATPFTRAATRWADDWRAIDVG